MRYTYLFGWEKKKWQGSGTVPFERLVLYVYKTGGGVE